MADPEKKQTLWSLIWNGNPDRQPAAFPNDIEGEPSALPSPKNKLSLDEIHDKVKKVGEIVEEIHGFVQMFRK